jgi:hypothetical protein
VSGNEALLRASFYINLAIASSTALGYISTSPWVMHIMLWPSLIFAPILLLGACVLPWKI